MSEIPEELNQPYPLPVLSKVINLGVRRIQELADEGILVREGRGKYPLADNVLAYIGFLRGVAQNAGQEIDFNAEKARKTKAEADIAEIEAAKAKGEVVELKDVERGLEYAFAEIKTNLRSVPSRVVGRIVGETEEHKIKEAILDEIDSILNELSQSINFENSLQATEEDDAEE